MTTNREKLNNMTNKELAYIFAEYTDCDRCPFKYFKCSGSEFSCKDIMLKWLESEE